MARSGSHTITTLSNIVTHLVHAAQPRVGVRDAAAEVHPGLDVGVLSSLAASPAQAQSTRGGAEKVSADRAHKQNVETNKGLKTIYSLRTLYLYVSFNSASATDPHAGAYQLGVMTGDLGLNISLK